MGEFTVKFGDLLAGQNQPDAANIKPKAEGTRVKESRAKEPGIRVLKKQEKQAHKATNKSAEVSMTTQKGNVNIQDQFLNHMRREKAPVTVHMLDGKEIHGHIKSFDNFCIQLESGGNTETLVYKHGISSITPSKISDYKKQG